jgi:hypothetical protein
MADGRKHGPDIRNQGLVPRAIAEIVGDQSGNPSRIALDRLLEPAQVVESFLKRRSPRREEGFALSSHHLCKVR